MSNAFKCDRCGGLEEGEPERYRIKYYATTTPLCGWSNSETLQSVELCEDCAEAFETAVGVCLDDERAGPVADAVERFWREKERRRERALRQTAPGQGDTDD